MLASPCVDNRMPAGPVALTAHAGAVLLLCAGVALVYARTAGFGYVQMDDTEYVLLSAPVMEGLSLDGLQWAFRTMRFSNWHPLTWLSYMVDVTLFGPGPGPQHVVNMLLHCANTVLVYAVAWSIARSRAAALIAAMLFGVHALHVESVAWIAERKDVLCALFYLLAVHLHIEYARAGGRARYLGIQLAAALAMLSKPMAVTLPFALLLLDWWPLRRVAGPLSARRVATWCLSPPVRLLLLEKLPICAMALGLCYLTVLAQQGAMAPAGDVSAVYRIENAILGYATYVRQWLLPTGLSPMYRMQEISLWREFVPALAVVVALGSIVLKLRRSRPWLLFGWLWFLGTLVPVIGLVQVGSQSHADRYMYIPSIGPLLALAMELALLGAAWMKRWRLVIAVVLCLHAALAWIQTGYWANPYMLFSRMLDTDSNGYQAHVGLSSYFLGLDELDLAEQHGIAAIQLNPTSHFVYANMGNFYLEKGDWGRAEAMYRMAIERLPFYPTAINNLGLALEQQGRLDEARQCFAMASAMDPALRGVSINVARLGK